MKFMLVWGFCFFTIAQAMGQETLIANRLRSVSKEQTKLFVKSNEQAYPGFEIETFFVPTKEQILSADKKFRPTLIARAEDDSKLRHRKEGILMISEIAHLYCGRFFGYVCKGEKRIACIYSLVTLLSDFEKEKDFAWIRKEWKDDPAGASLRFDYVLKNKSTTNFAVSGNEVGPFGTQRFSPLARPSKDVQAIRRVRDKQVRFKLDASKPFVLQIGRGNALDGLDTITLDESGKVKILEVFKERSCTLTISKSELKGILASVASNQLTSLYREYHDTNIEDGSQWILSIKQGTNQKLVYLNNYFPKQMVDFCDDLDDVISLEKRDLNWKHSKERSGLWGLSKKAGKRNSQ